jgi:hypothetical protein
MLRMTYCWWALSCLSAAVLQGAQTRIVGLPGVPCPNAQYTSIAAAVAAASAGDVIDICPGTYQEQLIITKPITLLGIEVNGVNRVLIQPTLKDLQGLATEAALTVTNTAGVTIRDLVIDASHNTVTACKPGLAAVRFLNASGTLMNSVVMGAQLANPLGCSTSFPYGNGAAVYVDNNPGTGPFQVSIQGNSIHDFTAYGVKAEGAGVTANITSNTITGVGPAGGIFQFGVFVVNGAVAQIETNIITEGLCGSLSTTDCINQRSEGVTLRAAGDGTVVDGNTINSAQSGIFINGANNLRVSNNQITNIDGMSGIDIQATKSRDFTNSLIEHNTITNVGPIDQEASNNREGCGIDEYSGAGTFLGNQIVANTVNDAYCGVAHVTANTVTDGSYFNTLYTELNSDNYTTTFPAAVEP